MSSMVKVAVVVLALPQSSVAVKVTLALPVAPQRSLNALKSLVQVTLLHSSVAAAPPLLASQAFSSVVLPAPSHSTVWSEALVVMVGGVLSSTVIVAVVCAVLPQSSVAVKVTSTVPVSPHKSLKSPGA